MRWVVGIRVLGMLRTGCSGAGWPEIIVWRYNVWIEVALLLLGLERSCRRRHLLDSLRRSRGLGLDSFGQCGILLSWWWLLLLRRHRRLGVLHLLLLLLETRCGWKVSCGRLWWRCRIPMIDLSSQWCGSLSLQLWRLDGDGFPCDLLGHLVLLLWCSRQRPGAFIGTKVDVETGW